MKKSFMLQQLEFYMLEVLDIKSDKMEYIVAEKEGVA
jgi:hypothetical protein